MVRCQPAVHVCTCMYLHVSCSGPPLQVALLARCKELGIPVLSVAGAGAKSDPTRLRFVDIAESSVDPLARAVRHK